MNKSPDAFRTISEVAEQLDVPAHVLRFWESRFSHVKPVKRGGGRRYYRPDDVRLLRGIRGLLYDDGMTIKGVQKILREHGVRHVIALGTVDETEIPSLPPVRAPIAPPERAPVLPAEAEPALVAAGLGEAPTLREDGPALGGKGRLWSQSDISRGHTKVAPIEENASFEGASRGASFMRGSPMEGAPAGGGLAEDISETTEEDLAPTARSVDCDALRQLVSKLEALRAVMVGTDQG